MYARALERLLLLSHAGAYSIYTKYSTGPSHTLMNRHVLPGEASKHASIVGFKYSNLDWDSAEAHYLFHVPSLGGER